MTTPGNCLYAAITSCDGQTDGTEGTNQELTWMPTGTATGATSATDGQTNTTTIYSYSTSGPAGRCYLRQFNSITDWFLPSKDEFVNLFSGSPGMGFSSAQYWTSTESHSETSIKRINSSPVTRLKIHSETADKLSSCNERDVGVLMSNPNQGPVNSGPPEVAVAEAATTNHLNVLVIGTDLGVAKMVQAAFQSVAADNSDKNYRVFPGTTKEKAIECVTKYPLHSILVDEDSILDTTPDKYVKDLRDLCKGNPANAAISIVLVCAKTDGPKTRLMVKVGWKDVLLKPFDNSLFLQKMNLYNGAIPVLAEPLLFTMDVAKTVDLSFTFQTKSVSEYGMKVESTLPLDAGLVMGVTAPFLETPLSAVVLESTKIADGQYFINLMFVGINPAETQSIRKMIRQEYAEEKQAA
jgi:response regulator of citrate/malate metabolism